LTLLSFAFFRGPKPLDKILWKVSPRGFTIGIYNPCKAGMLACKLCAGSKFHAAFNCAKLVKPKPAQKVSSKTDLAA